MIKKTGNLVNNCRDFVQTNLWHFSPDGSVCEPMWRRLTRVLVLAWREFLKNRCPAAAASLTFYTLMSIVPILAMVFAVAKGFNYHEMLIGVIKDQLNSYSPELADNLIHFAEGMLERTSAGGIAGVGVLVLLWAVYKLFSNIENTFNLIWGLPKGRPIFRRVADYITFSLLFFVVVLVLATLTGFAKAELPAILENMNLSEFAQTLIPLALKTFTLVLSWFFFTVIYMVVPNTKVSFSKAILPGIFAGTAFLSLQWLVGGQVLIFKANPVYGSLAVLPLFLLTLQLSWLFLLFGGELSYASQNLHDYAYESEHNRLSPKFLRHLTFMVLARIAETFDARTAPLTAMQISSELNIPIRIVRGILMRLQDAKIVSQVRPEKGREIAWQMALDTALLTPAFVVETLDSAGCEALPCIENEQNAQWRERLGGMSANLLALSNDETLTRTRQ